MSGKLYKIYNNLNSFFHGFSRGNPERKDRVQTKYVERWLDTIAFESLSELEKACAADASTIIRIIVNVRDNKFRQL